MLADHNTTIISRQSYIIALHFIVAEHNVKFSESLCSSCTYSIYQIGKVVAYSKLLEYVEKGNYSLTTFGMQNNREADVSSAHSCILCTYGKNESSTLH